MLKILQRMTNFEVDSQRFEILKEEVSTVTIVNAGLCFQKGLDS